MYTVTHDKITARAVEPVKITFTITDQNGDSVSVDGASATYKVARKFSDAPLLSITQSTGITLTGNTAIVEFNANDIGKIGTFIDQLAITKLGDTLIVSEGEIEILPVIQ